MGTKNVKRRSIAVCSSDYGTAERASKGSVVVEDRTATPGGVVIAQGARALVECVVDAYWKRCQIVDRQHAAGIRIRQMYRAAMLPGAVTASYGERRGGGGGIDSTSDARAALRSVLLRSGLASEAPAAPLKVTTHQCDVIEPVAFPLALRPAGHVVLSVCGLDEWAGGTRRLDLLREGLAALANHWRIYDEAAA